MKRSTRTVTVEEAAHQLGLSREAAYAAVARGDLPSLRIGRRLLVLRDPLERLLAGDVAAPAPPRVEAGSR